MKKYLSKPIIPVNNETYLSIIILLAPLLNLLSGINVDIYSPSMPSLASFFHTSIVTIKNTITITLLGWTIGAFLFGILIDSIGRKRVLIYGLLLYTIVSLLAVWSHSIHELMFVRFLQGVSIASITVGSRAIIIDSITGPRYAIAILYTSIGYGLGPIIGPFIGGILQHYIGWEANFVALAIVGFVLLAILLAFIEERIPERQPLRFGHVTTRFLSVFKNKRFLAGVFITGLTQVQIMLYPTLGPFIVENILHKNALFYGNTALVVGAGYLMGTLINRLLLTFFSPKKVCQFGIGIVFLALFFLYFYMIFMSLNLLTIMLPVTLTCVGAGFIYPNILGTNLKQFPKIAGAAMAIQAALLLFIAAIGIFVISHIHISGLQPLTIIYTVIALLQAGAYYGVYRKIFD